MWSNRGRTFTPACIAEAEAVIAALGAATAPEHLVALIEAVTRDLHFRHFALIDHDDLRVPRHCVVDLKRYPPAITDRLIARGPVPARSSDPRLCLRGSY